MKNRARNLLKVAALLMVITMSVAPVGAADTPPLSITIESPAPSADLPAWTPVEVRVTSTGGTSPKKFVLEWTKYGVTSFMACPATTTNWTAVTEGSGCVFKINADMGPRTIGAQVTDATGRVAMAAPRTITLG